MNWTDERVEKLKKLWADGLSASQIAAQLGGVSRNAVIGKVHRLNLPGRAKSGGQSSVRTKRATAAPRAPAYAGRTAAQTTHTVSRSSGGAALKQDVDAVAVEELDTRPMEDVVVPISVGSHWWSCPNGPANGQSATRCSKASTSAAMTRAMPHPIAAITPNWLSSHQANAGARANACRAQLDSIERPRTCTMSKFYSVLCANHENKEPGSRTSGFLFGDWTWPDQASIE
jgi:hypothetical protein